MARLLFLAPLLAFVAVAVYFLFLKAPPPLPQLDLDAWWGPERLRTQQDKSIKPFKVKFDEMMVRSLKEQLKSYKPFTPPLEGIAFEYGFNTKQLEPWVKYWAEQYNFSEREKYLNQFPQFKTNIQGLDIHFIRVKPQVPANVPVLPLLLLHGWPGSVREFYETIPLLTKYDEKRGFAVEVIVPSLVGYGFSDPAVRPGLSTVEMGVVMRNLMQRLGFKQFYVQGGDWGSIIGSAMSTLFPKEVLGYHSNMLTTMGPKSTILSILFSVYPSLLMEENLIERMYPLSSYYSFLLEEMGYFHLQATKPDTVGVALSDSPVGLLAYILEKFSTWTNFNNKQLADGGLTKYFTKDQLIDNLMLYWSTNSITTSMRLYSETFTKRALGLGMDQIPSPVPAWAIQARYELGYQPPSLLKEKFPNLLGTTVFHDGGHFFAFEKPKEFAEDVLKALQLFREYNAKKTKTEL